MLNLHFLLPLSDLEWPQCELLGLPPSVSSSSSWRVQTCCLWWQSSERGMPGLLRPDLLPSHFCQHQPSIKAHRERIPFFNLFFYIKSLWASDMAQWFKKKKKICLPMQETRVLSLDWEDALEKEMATHWNILAWEIPWTEEPGDLQYVGTQKSQTWLNK